MAQQVVEQIGARNYAPDIRAHVETEHVDYDLVITACVYWRDIAAPDGNYQEVEKIVPIWWELHTYEGDDRIECLNDATFARINEHIIAL